METSIIQILSDNNLHLVKFSMYLHVQSVCVCVYTCAYV